jgi:hypothetical protein
MRDEDGEREATLEVAQAREQRRDLGADILVDAMQAHEGVEDEQRRAKRGDGVGEARRSSSVSMRRVGAVMTSRSSAASVLVRRERDCAG